MSQGRGNPTGEQLEGHNGYKDAEVLECPGCGKEYVEPPSYYRHVADCTDLFS